MVSIPRAAISIFIFSYFQGNHKGHRFSFFGSILTGKVESIIHDIVWLNHKQPLGFTEIEVIALLHAPSVYDGACNNAILVCFYIQQMRKRTEELLYTCSSISTTSPIGSYIIWILAITSSTRCTTTTGY